MRRNTEHEICSDWFWHPFWSWPPQNPVVLSFNYVLWGKVLFQACINANLLELINSLGVPYFLCFKKLWVVISYSLSVLHMSSIYRDNISCLLFFFFPQANETIEYFLMYKPLYTLNHSFFVVFLVLCNCRGWKCTRSLYSSTMMVSVLFFSL